MEGIDLTIDSSEYDELLKSSDKEDQTSDTVDQNLENYKSLSSSDPESDLETMGANSRPRDYKYQSSSESEEDKLDNSQKYRTLSSSESEPDKLSDANTTEKDEGAIHPECSDIQEFRILRPRKRQRQSSDGTGSSGIEYSSGREYSSGIDDEVADKTYEFHDTSESGDSAGKESDGLTENDETNHNDTSDENDQGNDRVEMDRDSHSSSDYELNVEDISKSFKSKLRRTGISHRQAAKLILKCSQSNLCEAFKKAKKIKTSKKLTVKGMQIYKDMEKWILSKEMQHQTIKKNAQQKMLTKPSTSKKNSGGRKGTQFSFVQLCVLVELYRKNSRPSKQRKQLISETLELNESQVTTWFNNQRARDFIAEKQVEKMKKDGHKATIPQSWGSLFNDTS